MNDIKNTGKEVTQNVDGANDPSATPRLGFVAQSGLDECMYLPCSNGVGVTEPVSTRPFELSSRSAQPSHAKKSASQMALPYSNISENTWESTESISGYANGDRASDDEVRPSAQYRTRLRNFYAKYNPEKVDRVDEFLAAYHGEEEQLFAILVGKYGPEPEVPGRDGGSGRAFGSEPGSSTQHGVVPLDSEGSVMHFAGPRYVLPRVVLPADGNTDCETPYWPGSSVLISDRDILSLLRELVTENVELSKCFLGFIESHPSESWNGMTYITRAPIPPSSQQFLGHYWAGSLANSKFMVHSGTTYKRTVLHCTEECQRLSLPCNAATASGAAPHGHERWRLSIYVTEQGDLQLIRAVWDPPIALDALPVSQGSLSSTSEGAWPAQGNGRAAQATSRSSRYRGDCQPVQPVQSPIIVALESMAQMIAHLDEKFTRVLESIESRVMRIEKHLTVSSTATPLQSTVPVDQLSEDSLSADRK